MKFEIQISHSAEGCQQQTNSGYWQIRHWQWRIYSPESALLKTGWASSRRKAKRQAHKMCKAHARWLRIEAEEDEHYEYEVK